MAGHLTKSSNSGFDDDMNSDPSAMTLPGDHAPFVCASWPVVDGVGSRSSSPDLCRASNTRLIKGPSDAPAPCPGLP